MILRRGKLFDSLIWILAFSSCASRVGDDETQDNEYADSAFEAQMLEAEETKTVGDSFVAPITAPVASSPVSPVAAPVSN